VQQERPERPQELLIHAEIVPLLPSLSTADRRLIHSDAPRSQALAAVIRAADELLAEATGKPVNFGAAMILSSNPPAASDVPGEAPIPARTREAQLWGPSEWSLEPDPAAKGSTAKGSTAKGRRLTTPLAIAAGLVLLALVVAGALTAVSKSSTHVATTKTTATTGARTDVTGTPPPSPTAPGPPPAAAPGATGPDDTVNTAVPDFAVPPLPAAPPTTQVVCPAGKVTAAVRKVQAQQSASDSTGWDVTVTGTVTNGTNTPIIAPSVDVTVRTNSGEEPAYGDSDSSQLGPGQTGTWTATSYVSSTTPPTATAQPGKWVWADSRYEECPTADSAPASAR